MPSRRPSYRQEVVDYGIVRVEGEGEERRVVAEGAQVRDRDGRVHSANIEQTVSYPYRFHEPDWGVPQSANYSRVGGRKQYRGQSRRLEEPTVAAYNVAGVWRE